MLFIGTGFGVAALIINNLYARWDYWNPIYIIPQVPFEDFYYGFIFGGISAVAYELVLSKGHSVYLNNRLRADLLFLFGLLTVGSFWFIVDVLRLNSIIAHFVSPFLIGLISIAVHKAFYKTAVLSALMMVFFDFIQFQILLLLDQSLFTKHWALHNLSGRFVLSVPIEELLYAFAIGFGAANAYEVIYGKYEEASA